MQPVNEKTVGDIPDTLRIGGKLAIAFTVGWDGTAPTDNPSPSVHANLGRYVKESVFDSALGGEIDPVETAMEAETAFAVRITGNATHNGPQDATPPA